jgi:hypothetical protein
VSAKFIKLTIAFAGGQLLAGRVTEDDLRMLRAALAGDRGVHELALEDGTVTLDLAQVAYVRVDSDEPRVGFGA